MDYFQAISGMMVGNRTSNSISFRNFRQRCNSPTQESVSVQDGDHDEEEDQAFPPWRQLIKFSWELLKPGQEMPRTATNLTQFAAPVNQQEGPQLDCFPDSPLLLASLQSAMNSMLGREWLSPNDPASVPPAATVKAKKWITDYRKKYYVDSKVQEVPATAPKFSAAELDLLKPRISVGKIPVPMEDVAHLEQIMRQALMSLNAVEWLFGSLGHLVASNDQAIFEQVWAATTRSLRHATQFTAAAVASSTVIRRQVFLDQCDESKVPKRAKPWLTFQPLPTNDINAMFGSALNDLRQMAYEERQAKLISMATTGARALDRNRQPQRNYQSRGNFTNYKSNRPTASVSSPNDTRSRNSGRTRPFNRSGRSFRGK